MPEVQLIYRCRRCDQVFDGIGVLTHWKVPGLPVSLGDPSQLSGGLGFTTHRCSANNYGVSDLCGYRYLDDPPKQVIAHEAVAAKIRQYEEGVKLFDDDGREVTNLVQSDDGQECLAQFDHDDAEWLLVRPEELSEACVFVNGICSICQKAEF